MKKYTWLRPWNKGDLIIKGVEFLRVAETEGSEGDDVCIKSVRNSYPLQS